MCFEVSEVSSCYKSFKILPSVSIHVMDLLEVIHGLEPVSESH